jgi:integrase
MGRKRTGGVEIREGSIRVLFQYQGKRERRTLMIGTEPMAPTPANIKHARRIAAEIHDRIRLGVFVMAEYFPANGNAHTGTLADQLQTWLAVVRAERSTLKMYKSGVRFWTTAEVEGKPLGLFHLRALRTSHLLLATATRPWLSGKTVNNYVSVVREALELAVTDKLLAENPAAAVKSASYQKPPIDPFEREETEEILREAHKRYPEPVFNLIETWFFSGLRTSEIFGLRWPQVHLKKNAMTISEAIIRGYRKQSTKTNLARTVLLNSRSSAAFERQRAHTQLAGELVFLHPLFGDAWNEDNFCRRYWAPLLSRLAIRYRRPYNMRHTYATVMLMAGMTPAFGAKQMGHSIQMFLTTYAKWIDGGQNAVEMQRLEANLSLDCPRSENESG